MRTVVESDKFDVWLEPSDWRYSATIVGLSKYLRYYGDENQDYEITDEYLKFRSADITQEKYLLFVEAEYGEELQHKQLENLLMKEEVSEEQIKLANDLLKTGNAIMKEVFGKSKFDGTNQGELLEKIRSNRQDLIWKTFLNKDNMYANFAPTRKGKRELFEEGKICCRLLGYDVDIGRKSKSIAYNFDVSTFQAQDDSFFDFIPFAFFGDRETFFINANYSVRSLLQTNQNFERMIKMEVIKSEGKSKDARKVLFKSIQETADFIDFDTEVIVKNRGVDFFETLYIRKESIKILTAIKEYDSFCFSIKINDKYYVNIQKEVLECILNLVRTDELIELLFRKREEKIRTNIEYIVSKFIQINQLISGGGSMNQSMKVAYACAKEVTKKLPDNKRTSYRQKLTSAIIFKDYDRYCQILLQLSNYADVSFDFALDLFEDFEENKDIAYTFINALTKAKVDNKEEK